MKRTVAFAVLLATLVWPTRSQGQLNTHPVEVQHGIVLRLQDEIGRVTTLTLQNGRTGTVTRPGGPALGLTPTLSDADDGVLVLFVGVSFLLKYAVERNALPIDVRLAGTAAAALAWMLSEWAAHGKPSALGIVSGAVAGLVAITPASGTAGPAGALLIGLSAGVLCFLAATKLKRALGYDDSLDVFGVHAVGGIVGAILTGVCAGSLGGVGLAEGVSIGQQVWTQTKSVLFTLVFSGVLTFVILKIVDAIVGLRVTPEQETEGLDLALHDERAYNA